MEEKMKINFLSLSLIIGSLLNYNQSIIASDDEKTHVEELSKPSLTIIRHSHCKKIGDFCHHDAGIACLQKNKKLSAIELSHFFNKHLGSDISTLNLQYQNAVDSPLVQVLAQCKKAHSITSLNLAHTSVGYAGIVELLKSPSFGSLRCDQPLFEPHTETPISIVNVEIAFTRAFEQYIAGKFKYPLPLLENFCIFYGNIQRGPFYSKLGYKQVRLLCNGEELAPSLNRPLSRKNNNILILNQLQDTFPGPHDMIDHGRAQRQRHGKIDSVIRYISDSNNLGDVNTLVVQSCRFEPGDYLSDLLNICFGRIPNLQSITFITVVLQERATQVLRDLLAPFKGSLRFYNCSVAEANPRSDRNTAVILSEIFPRCIVDQKIPREYLQ